MSLLLAPGHCTMFSCCGPKGPLPWALLAIYLSEERNLSGQADTPETSLGLLGFQNSLFKWLPSLLLRLYLLHSSVFPEVTVPPVDQSGQNWHDHAPVPVWGLSHC